MVSCSRIFNSIGRGAPGPAMVAEPLVQKVLSKATFSKKAKKAGAASTAAEDGRVGILSFEVANAMLRAASLHRSLSDAESARLLGPLCLGSRVVRALVEPDDDARLLALALAEKLDALNRVATVAVRLGRRCSAPAFQGFDHVYADLLAGRSGVLSRLPLPLPQATPRRRRSSASSSA